MNPLSQNVVRAGVASGWIFASRILGLLWTALLIAKLGLGEYGIYAIAYAIAAIVAAPLDNIFHVRALRVPENLYHREAASRAIVGAVLLLVGVVLFVPAFVIGFAAVIAGGEILFNTVKGDALRSGQPNIVMRLDAIRQTASVGLAAVYLFASLSPTLELTVAAYAVPYAVVFGSAMVRVYRRRPGRPGNFREMAGLWFDASANALYLQGDILLLGLLATSEVTGLYSVASVVTLAAASFAQMFAHTFHESLRGAKGDPRFGPSKRMTLGVSLLLGMGVLAVGAVGAVAGYPEAGTLLMVMSVVVVLRSLALVYTTMLYIQHRDGHRVAAGWTAAILKLGLVAALVSLGAMGAAIAAAVAELVLVVWYFRVVYAWKPGSADDLTLPPPRADVS